MGLYRGGRFKNNGSLSLAGLLHGPAKLAFCSSFFSKGGIR